MKNIVSTFLLLFFTVTSQLSAQSIWKYFSRPDYGFVVHNYAYDETLLRWSDSFRDGEVENNYTQRYWGTIVGTNLPLVPLMDHLSLGLNPNIAITTGIFSSIGSNSGTEANPLAIELPWYATIKLGTDASRKKTNFPLGVTAGIGYHYTAFIFPEDNSIGGFGLPSFILEANWGTPKSSWGLFKVRYIQDIGTYSETYVMDTGKKDVSVSRQGFQFVFALGY